MKTAAEKVAVLALVAARCNALSGRKKVRYEMVEDAFRIFTAKNVQPESSSVLLEYVDEAVTEMFEEWSKDA